MCLQHAAPKRCACCAQTSVHAVGQPTNVHNAAACIGSKGLKARGHSCTYQLYAHQPTQDMKPFIKLDMGNTGDSTIA